MRRTPAAVAVLTAAVAWGCGGRPTPDSVVLEIDGQSVRLREWDAYALAALAGVEQGELAPDDRDLVMSRIFDGFVREQLLLQEARRLGIEVPDSELQAFMGSGIPTSGLSEQQRRALALRHLTIRKLEDALVRSTVRIERSDVATYLEKHAGDLMPRRTVVLRALALEPGEDGAELRAGLLSGDLDFDREALVRDPSGAQPLTVALSTLPGRAREVVAALEPGQISEPVALAGTTYLLRLEAKGEEPPEDETALAERAVGELLRVASERAVDRLVARLRQEADIEIHEGNLPFRYVAAEEETSSSAPVADPASG